MPPNGLGAKIAVTTKVTRDLTGINILRHQKVDLEFSLKTHLLMMFQIGEGGFKGPKSGSMGVHESQKLTVASGPLAASVRLIFSSIRATTFSASIGSVSSRIFNS